MGRLAEERSGQVTETAAAAPLVQQSAEPRRHRRKPLQRQASVLKEPASAATPVRPMAVINQNGTATAIAAPSAAVKAVPAGHAHLQQADEHVYQKMERTDAHTKPKGHRELAAGQNSVTTDRPQEYRDTSVTKEIKNAKEVSSEPKEVDREPGYLSSWSSGFFGSGSGPKVRRSNGGGEAFHVYSAVDSSSTTDGDKIKVGTFMRTQLGQKMNLKKIL